MRPIILVATTCRWFSTPRLAMALAKAGCAVEAVCPSRHPLEKTKAVRRTHIYRGLAPLTSFAEAIAAAKPDLVIPSDDLATKHLHDLYARERRRGREGAAVCALLERSLGAPESFSVVYKRTAVLDLARDERIRVPYGEVIANHRDLQEWIKRTGLPTVLKSDGTSGGEGVRIVHTPAEAYRAFRALQAPPLLARAVKHALIDRDMTLLLPLLLRRRRVVNAQTFVPGREATSLVACSNGAVLSSLHFEVLHKQDATGPASVLRLTDHPEMLEAAEKIVRRLNLSGLHGFDFMLEAGTGNPYLIEINPRTTQVGHLRLGPGRDLPAALFGALAGTTAAEAVSITDKQIIALFPQEWTRDPESPFLRSGYHDVPWEEPELIRAGVRRLWKWGAWYLQRKWTRAFTAVGRLRL